MKRLIYIAFIIAMSMSMMTACGKKDVVTDIKQNQSDGNEQTEQNTGESEIDSVEVMKAGYMDFIKGNTKATVQNPNIEGLEAGKEYSYDEMSQAYVDCMSEMFEEAKLSDASYAYIDCGADGLPELAIKQTISTQMDEATMYTILKYIDGKINLVSGRYGYYRSYVDVNEYGYISFGGSGGAAIFYSSSCYVNKDGEEVFLYSETDEMDFGDSYISSYNFPGHEAPDGYSEDIFSMNDNYITCVTYNFTEYNYDEEQGDDDYYRDNFYTFYDADGNYHEPNDELAKIYKENGIKYYSLEETEKMVKDHEEALGVTEEIKNGGEIKWISLLSEGIGLYSRDIIASYGIMGAVPGKWKMPENNLAEGIEAVYLEIDETGEFELNIVYSDNFTAPSYAKGHLVLEDASYYQPLFYLYINSSNFEGMEERTYEGGFSIAEYTLNSEKIAMTLESDNDTFLAACAANAMPVFEKAYSDETYDSYSAVFNPSEEYYYYDYDDNSSASKEAKPIELKELSCTENEITDEDVWFERVGMEWNAESYSDEKYTYHLGGVEGYGTNTMLYIYENTSGKLLKTYDFHDFVWADGYEYNDYVERSISYALIKDEILYVNLYHRTYAESCPSNAYVIAIDMNTDSVIWKTEPLVSNSYNFIIIGDNIVTGYGFSAEDHYLSIIDKKTGKLLKKDSIKKSPEYFYYKDNILYVRTYSYDYEFEVKVP